MCVCFYMSMSLCVYVCMSILLTQYMPQGHDPFAFNITLYILALSVYMHMYTSTHTHVRFILGIYTN